jgi:hypothetical protein
MTILFLVQFRKLTTYVLHTSIQTLMISKWRQQCVDQFLSTVSECSVWISTTTSSVPLLTYHTHSTELEHFNFKFV